MFDGSLSANIHLAVIAVFSFLVLFGAIIGFCRGFSKQIIRSITVIASVVLAFWCSRIAWNYFNDYFGEKSVEQIQAIVSGYVPIDTSWLLNFDVETVRALIAIPIALVVVPILFVLAFFIIKLLMLIIHAILCGIFGLSRRRKSFVARLLGMALGALQGVVVAGVLFLPLLGAASHFDASVSAVVAADPENESVTALADKYNLAVRNTLDGTVAKTLSFIGVSKLYDGITTVPVGEEKIRMVETVDDAVGITGKVMSLKGADWKKLNENDKAKVTSIVDTLAQSEHFSTICAGLLRGVAKTVDNGQLIVNAGPPVDSIVYTILDIFETESAGVIGKDLNTISALYFILSDCDALSAFGGDSEAMLQALSSKDSQGKTNVSKAIEVLKANERMKPLITLISRLSVSVMSKNLNLGEGTEELYENVKAGLSEAANIKKSDYETEQEYVDAVSASIEDSLRENGIELDEDIVNSMASYVSENIEQLENISDDELNDLILHYYEAYAASIESE